VSGALTRLHFKDSSANLFGEMAEQLVDYRMLGHKPAVVDSQSVFTER